MEKPLSIPLTIPRELEDYIHNEFLPSVPNLPRSYTRKPVLTIIHDALLQNDSAVLPSLRDTETETGNPRYWIIDNRNIWAGQHPMVDELFELYKGIFLSQSAVRPQVGPSNGVHSPQLENKCDAADPNFILALAHILKQRIVPPSLSYENSRSGSNIDPTERFLFEAWALSDPGRCDESSPLEGDEDGDGRREPFDQDDYPYSVPDSLFWKEGDEEQWPSDLIPEWRKAPQVNNHIGELIRDNIRRNDAQEMRMIIKNQDIGLGFTEIEVTFSACPVSFNFRTFASLEDYSYPETDEEDEEDEEDVDEDISEAGFSSDDGGF